MDFLRLGEGLLRSPQPLLPFLAPSVYRASRGCGLISRHCKPSPSSRNPPSRSFITSPFARQQESGSSAEEGRENRSPPPPTSNIGDEFSELLEGAISRSKGTPTAPTGRTSRFKAPVVQDYNSPSRLESRREQDQNAIRDQKAGAIAEILDAAYPINAPRQQQPQASQSILSSRIDVAAMLDPFKITNRTQPAPPPPLPEPPPMKLNSSVGRTIQVDSARGMDVARAFRALEVRCARNNVRRDSIRQKFHERPGLKRKRLKSERWRKRFRETFNNTIAMVQRMKAQGW